MHAEKLTYYSRRFGCVFSEPCIAVDKLLNFWNLTWANTPDTRRQNQVFTTSFQRPYNVVLTSCVGWEWSIERLIWPSFYSLFFSENWQHTKETTRTTINNKEDVPTTNLKETGPNIHKPGHTINLVQSDDCLNLLFVKISEPFVYYF